MNCSWRRICNWGGNPVVPISALAGEAFAIGDGITTPELDEDNARSINGVKTGLNPAAETHGLSGVDVPTFVLGAIFLRDIGRCVVGGMNIVFFCLQFLRLGAKWGRILF